MRDREAEVCDGGQGRRRFIASAAAAAAVFSGVRAVPATLRAQVDRGGVAIIPDSAEEMTSRPAIRWAIEQLRAALEGRAIAVRVVDRLDQASRAEQRIVVSRSASGLARPIIGAAGMSVPDGPEAFGIVRGVIAGRPVLLVCGSDVRGTIYGLLELADLVTHAEQPVVALRDAPSVTERAANPIRGIGRVFLSEAQDKPWFDDRAFWSRYLSMLVTQRFNRFHLILGLGYDALRDVRDSYFNFAYPFLVSVPGSDVSATGLSPEERERNLAMLRWVSEQAALRGLHFQLGLWNHGYEYPESPMASYPITGLARENHAAYCRDGLRLLLETCPAIQGVTLRCHSESGVQEGGGEFWRTVFDGVGRCGRRVEIDIHGKGVEHTLLETALRTGQPVNVSPKFSAEHMGLPYHPTSIQQRERFRPAAGREYTVEQKRSFTRYGYGDFLRDDRAYGVFHRIWPATQRLLLWGDPMMAAGFGRQAAFCGSRGLELFEPLSLKGRRGAALAGGRETYADSSLRPPGGDWEKYLQTYRVWGRLLYDPEADPIARGRHLRKEFGAAAPACESALAHASRILPLMTTAHMTSPSVGAYWPEIHTNTPIVTDQFSAVSALDPELFSSIDEYADQLTAGGSSGKYSPLDVAQWLERLAATAEAQGEQARLATALPTAPAFRRLHIDVAVQAGIGRHLADKLRAGVAYALARRLDDSAALKKAVEYYRSARDRWAGIVAVTRNVYRKDLVFDVETRPYLRGHWSDRLPAIEEDLAKLGEISRRNAAPPAGSPAVASALLTAALAAAAAPLPRPRCGHAPPAAFRRGEPLVVEMAAPPGAPLVSARLHYRRVNHAEELRTADFVADGNRFRQAIPGDYTDSPYPIFYYFEVRDGRGTAWFSPGFDPDLSNQPYYVVRSRKSS